MKVNANDQTVVDIAKKLSSEKNLSMDEKKRLIDDALSIARDSIDYQIIATHVCHDKVLADKVWGRKLFEKALELANLKYGFLHMYDTARQIATSEQLNDKIWAKEIYTEVIDRTGRIDDLIEIAYDVSGHDILNDKSLAKKSLKNALKLALNTSDKQAIAEAIANDKVLGDKHWAREIFENAQ